MSLVALVREVEGNRGRRLYEEGVAMQGVPHPFNPLPIEPGDHPGRPCGPRCACSTCFLQKREHPKAWGAL